LVWLIALTVFALGTNSAIAQPLGVSLTNSDYNGFAVSCFGESDGWISAQVTGGTPPYRYTWSQGDTIAQINNVPAGYYHLAVVDADSGRVTAEVTLMQPGLLKVFTTPYLYPNGYNISCINCFNGSIEASAAGGVPPYSYLWNDSVATQNRSGLGHKFGYQVTVTDASDCKMTSQRISLIQPDPNVWAMNGNTNTDPDLHFVGTTDSADLVLKTSGQERLRLTGQGDVKLLGQGQQPGLVYRMEDGTLRGGGLPQWPPLVPPLCYGGLEGFYPYWQTTGNDFAWLCPEVTPLLGTLGARPLIMVTDGEERMRIAINGEVGIGTGDPQDQLEIHTALERNGITLVNTRQDDNAHTEIRFKKNSDERWALGCDIAGNGGQDFFIWDALATTKRLEINAQGKVGIGTVPPLNGSIYKLYVADGIATRDVMVTASTTWPDYVFADGYRLMPLPELRTFLQQHRHLPGIPSAAEVEEQGGVEVGDMQVRLLKVVEEQALYILQLEERIKALEQRN
jgi:hypothetical protein